jgi:hypothetical protein
MQCIGSRTGSRAVCNSTTPTVLLLYSCCVPTVLLLSTLRDPLLFLRQKMVYRYFSRGLRLLYPLFFSIGNPIITSLYYSDKPYARLNKAVVYSEPFRYLLVKTRCSVEYTSSRVIDTKLFTCRWKGRLSWRSCWADHTVKPANSSCTVKLVDSGCIADALYPLGSRVYVVSSPTCLVSAILSSGTIRKTLQLSCLAAEIRKSSRCSKRWHHSLSLISLRKQLIFSSNSS